MARLMRYRPDVELYVFGGVKNLEFLKYFEADSAFECSFECFRVFQIRFEDFVGEFAMFVWIARQGAHLEFAAGLQGTYYSASLLSRRADHGDQFFLIG